MVQQQLQMKASVRPRCFGLTAMLITVLMLCYVMPAEAKNITAKFPEEQLSIRLKKIGEQGDADILFDLKEAGTTRVSALNATNLTVEQALERSLSGTIFSWKKTAETSYAVLKKADDKQPQAVQAKGLVSGKITDENGEVLPGVTICPVGTKQGAVTDINGFYRLTMPAGNYSVEISTISYQKQKITDVEVKGGKTTSLNLSMKLSINQLNDVVVSASYKKNSVNSLYQAQRKMEVISNGISAEQIARTPDKNIGESLKRISGVSTVDNKFVLVRGIGERYNSAMLDGVLLPNTEAQSRNFSFDMIPSNLVDNVVVSKTVTPDMNASFGGGLIQINTKDIPNENFMTFTAGASYNDQSTGKDFLSHKRGKYDYFGFDDGRRDYPGNLQQTDATTAPNRTLTQQELETKIIDQSKRFTNDNVSLYKYKAAPSQNYQFTMGRLLALDTVGKNKLGFTGSVSYRNTQTINVIDKQLRGDWNPSSDNPGGAYSFNTTLGALLNVGLQLGQNHFSLRNTYTHLYDNTLVRNVGYDNDNGSDDIFYNRPANRIRETDDPTFTDLLQNKLGGKHNLGKVKIDWDLARTSINREEKDMINAGQGRVAVGNGYEYFYSAGSMTEPRQFPLSRHNYKNEENHYSWNLTAAVPFTLAGIRNNLKAGYFGIRKKASFNWQIAALTSRTGYLGGSQAYIPVGEMINPETLSMDGYFYSVSPWWSDSYEGKSNTHAGFVMLDTRIVEKLRLVWGVRGEYYKYTEIKNGLNQKGTSNFTLPDDKKMQWLPSANLTYSPTDQINIRGAFSSSVIRPELMENSQFWRYSPYLGASFGSDGIYSTRINSYDFKTEWFPGPGEIISVGGFYKKFDRPAELVYDNLVYTLRSSDWAKVYGLELEMRKSLGFIAPNKILDNFFVYGNLTLLKSTVAGTYDITDPAGGADIPVTSTQKRSMYGQSPYLFNAGLQYSGERLGLNLMYNGSGYKTYTVAALATDVEYEKPRRQLDAQISYKLLHKQLEIKLNAGNLLNMASTFYRNTASYEKNPDYATSSLQDYSNALRLLPGFSNKYEEGDMVMFSQKFGRTYSLLVSYNF